MAELTFTANDRDGSAVTILDGTTDTGYRLLSGMALGDPVFATEFSGPRSTHGARPAGASAENRTLSLTIRCQGATKDGLAAKESALALVMDRIRRFGGRVSWRSNNQTYRQHALAFTASMAAAAWDNRAESNYRREVTCSFTCAPYLEGDPCDIEDTFDTDSLSDYTSDGAIAAADLIVTGGLLAVDTTGNPANEFRLIHTDTGYEWNNYSVVVQARTPTGTLTNWKLGAVVSYVDSDDYVEAYLDDNGTNSRIRIDTVIAGVRANVATKNLAARIIAATPYAIRVNAAKAPTGGNTVGILYFSGANDIDRYSTATDSLIGTPTVVASQAGLSHVALKDVGDTGYGGVTVFRVEPLRGTGAYRQDADDIPGDAPAKADVNLELNSAVDYRWAAFAWHKPAAWNLCLNPVFTTDASGWDTTGVTGLCAATTTATVTTGVAFIGDKALRITPNGSDTSGVAYPIYNHARVARAGSTLTLKARVRSDSSTATVEALFGWSGAAQGTTGSVTLATQWQEVTATVTSTLSIFPVYVVIRVDGTGTTAFDLDAVSVYVTEEGEPPLHTFPTGPVPPFGVLAPAQSEAGGGAGNTTGATTILYQSDASIAAGGETETMSVWVGPHFADPDDYAEGELLLEVWSEISVHTAFGPMTLTLAGGDNADQYALEYGATGYTLPDAAGNGARLVKFGTLPIPAGPALGQQAYKITLSVAIAADTNAQPFTWHSLVFMNPRKRVMTPTGKAQADVPFFRQAPASGNTITTIHSDLSRSTKGLLQNGPGPGVGGESMIEIPPGSYQAMFLAHGAVPNDPGGTVSGSLTDATAFRLSLTPRWHWLRDG